MTGKNRAVVMGDSSHFAFGKNWASYAKLIGETEIAEAESGLTRLLGGDRLDGKRFLDIGCGSGLHSLAALRIGAREVLAVDIDPDSVATTRALLDHHAAGARYTVQLTSVFDLDSVHAGHFDVVYSWGVLHHTGNLTRALQQAAALVAPGGVFVFALYRKTWMCPVWRFEKRWYVHAGARAQSCMRAVYITLFRAGLRVTGRRLTNYMTHYNSNRGMDFYHDVHDWLGGYPYESITHGEVAKTMSELGFTPVRAFLRNNRFIRLFGKDHGLFGSGCDEYVYARPA